MERAARARTVMLLPWGPRTWTRHARHADGAELGTHLLDSRMCRQFEVDCNRLNQQYGNDLRYDDSVGDEAQAGDYPCGYLPSWRGCATRRRTRSW